MRFEPTYRHCSSDLWLTVLQYCQVQVPVREGVLPWVSQNVHQRWVRGWRDVCKESSHVRVFVDINGNAGFKLLEKRRVVVADVHLQRDRLQSLLENGDIWVPILCYWIKVRFEFIGW